jgi:hypothetical protein
MPRRRRRVSTPQLYRTHPERQKARPDYSLESRGMSTAFQPGSGSCARAAGV